VVPIELGDRLELTICSQQTDLLAIAPRRLGLFQGVTPNSPARMDLLPGAVGSYGITFLRTGKVAARIRVDPPTKEAREEPGPAAKSGRCEPAAP
jgi:hypothetical protein